MSHIIGHRRYAREIYPRSPPPGAQGPPGPQGPGGGLAAWGADTIGTVAAPSPDGYRLPPWNQDVSADANPWAWAPACETTLSCLSIRHNVAGVGGDIRYEVYIGGVASGLFVTLAASGTFASAVSPSVIVPAGIDVELRASHAGIATSPQRIIVTAASGSSAFGLDYDRVDSAALFTTGAGLSSPTAFVLKPGASLTTPALIGTYRVGWHALVNTTAANVNSAVRLFNVTDAVVVGSSPQRFEPSSSSQEIEDVNGANTVVFAGAPKTFQLEVRKFSGPNPGAVSVQDAWIELWRVA